MKLLRRQVLIKVVAGIVMVLCAAFFSLLIKDGLAQRDPVHALPLLDVYFNDTDEGEKLPASNLMLDSYTWRFLVNTKTDRVVPSNAWQDMDAAWVPPGAPLSLAFSFKEKNCSVVMASEGEDFVELGGELAAPSEPGNYTYRVEASWGKDRSVVYYFKIRVPLW